MGSVKNSRVNGINDLPVFMHQGNDIPQPKKPEHSSTRRFCVDCFEDVLGQTKRDLEKLKAL